VEVFGPESSGKTTLTLHAIAECQRAGGTAVFIDAEHALDVTYAAALGVDPKKLYVSQPDSGEQALDIAETLIKSMAVDLLVVDSVAALVPQDELDGNITEQQVGLQARLMSKAMRKLASLTRRTGTVVMWINQLRMKIGQSFGSPETTTGGNALKYYASLRIDVRRIGTVKAGEESLGNRTRVKVVKNKVAPPFKRAEFDIRWGEGIDAVSDLLDMAVERDVLKKNGAYYAMGDKTLAQGRENVRKAMLEDAKLRERIRTAVLAPPSAPEAAQPVTTKKAA
ncbi:MAG: recombinase RecA, partial [Polyangiales bacterium]